MNPQGGGRGMVPPLGHNCVFSVETWECNSDVFQFVRGPLVTWMVHSLSLKKSRSCLKGKTTRLNSSQSKRYVYQGLSITSITCDVQAAPTTPWIYFMLSDSVCFPLWFWFCSEEKGCAEPKQGCFCFLMRPTRSFTVD